MRKKSCSSKPVSGIAPKTEASTRGFVALQALLIIAVTWWIYQPALNGDWIWDDTWYVTGNPLMWNQAGLWKIWFVPGSWVVYYPIETSVQWLEWQGWGNATLGYHLTNLFLHLLSAFLLWRLLARLGMRLAWLGGLLFAAHPLMVESVVWITELKNTLSLPPLLLAMLAWIDYQERKTRSLYLLTLSLFLFAMLCKVSVAGFPLVMLLYVWWKRRRVEKSDLWSCVPFLIVAVELIMANVHQEKLYHLGHPVTAGTDAHARLVTGIVYGLTAVPFLFAHFFWPFGLMPIYPAWKVDASLLPWLLTLPIMGAALFVFWRQRETWGRHALLGLGAWLLNLLPVMGSLVMTSTDTVWCLDHLSYLPSVGLIGLSVAALEYGGDRLPVDARRGGMAFIAGLCALLAWESHGYAGKFVNEKTLWSYTLERNPNDVTALNNLGKLLLNQGRADEAKADFEQVLRLAPDDADGHYNLGNALQKMGLIPDAMRHYARALQINPGYAGAYVNLGNCLVASGRVSEAIEFYEQAVRLEPEAEPTRYDLGAALLQANRLPEAGEQFSAAVRLDPTVAQAHLNLGVVLARSGRSAEAIPEFEAAVRIKPDYLEARRNLGMALEDEKRLPEAIREFEAALQIDPGDATAQAHLRELRPAAR